VREIQVCQPRRDKESAVRRLQYLGDGSELAAWVGEEDTHGQTTSLHVHSFATSETREPLADEWFWHMDERASDPVLSPDGRFALIEFGGDDFEGWLLFEDLTRIEERNEAGFFLPHLPTPAHGFGGLQFTPDGADLIAVRNDDHAGTDRFARDVARFTMATFINPPLRFEEKVNPLSGKAYQAPVYNERWRAGGTLPDGPRISSAALSGDGRLLAFGEVGGAVHVARLKARSATVIASFTPQKGKTKGARGPKRKIADDFVTKVAFSPDAKSVAWLAGGSGVIPDVPPSVFARSLDGKSEWQTDSDGEPVHDFAFHPSGKFLCTVSDDGHARHLDARTGAVVQSFKWAKRSKRPLRAVCFSPDGLTCAAGDTGGKVFVWDVDA
jgi:hypothetical protein